MGDVFIALIYYVSSIVVITSIGPFHVTSDLWVSNTCMEALDATDRVNCNTLLQSNPFERAQIRFNGQIPSSKYE